MTEESQEIIDPTADTGLPVPEEVERRVESMMEEVRERVGVKLRASGNSEKFIDEFFEVIRRFFDEEIKPQLEQQIREKRGFTSES